MRLLLAGDIHIGRGSTRLTDSSGGIRAADAWDRIVDTAIAERCEMLLLSGDVTDKENRYFEAIGPLQRGIERLAAHDITTIAVAGNHDHGVLGRLADTMESRHFSLLGRGGQWQRMTVRDDDGHPILHLDGWSFPRERVSESPLAEYAFAAAPDAPILGMVHGDLDTPGSPYAPLSLERLRGLPTHGWLLGHIHKPQLRGGAAGEPWVLYPGSPQALDPGEEGMHGAWLLEIEDGRLGLPRQVPISTVRYEWLVVDISGVATADGLEDALYRAMRTETARVAEQSGSALTHLVLRLKIVGATDFTDRLRDAIDSLRAERDPRIDAIDVTVDRILDETTPAIDLASAARSPSAVGVVARLLVALDRAANGDPAAPSGDTQSTTEPIDIDDLVAQTRGELDRLRAGKGYGALPAPEVTTKETLDALRLQASRLLTELVRQQPRHASSRVDAAGAVPERAELHP